MKTEASKKWVVSQYMDTDEWGIIDEDNHIIVGISSRITKETGEKIVRAVNAYDAMAEALDEISRFRTDNIEASEARNRLDKVIAFATKALRLVKEEN